jgi:aspartate carbamoyltransferase catalytic subunit
VKHILSVDQFSKADLDMFCERAKYYEDYVPNGVLRGRGKILANLFYEPSTRTSSSFYAAMVRLGGSVIPINEVRFSSVAKGETLEDTIRTMQCYTDAIVLRHPEVGAALRAASIASVPIINAGDGDNEHPTQALLDFYTIRKHFNKSDALHVLMMGDLVHGRTVKSLAKLLRKDNARITWVSPHDLRVQAEYVHHGEVQTDNLTEVIDQADVLYVTRVQHERGSSAAVYGVTPEHMTLASKHMLLMHPLPRLAELPTSLDADPRSAYFRQMRNGLFMRMAILANVMKL